LKKILAAVVIILVLSVLAAGCGQTTGHTAAGVRQQEITVSAGVGLKDALKKIQADYEKAHPQVKIIYNLGASGALQQQIEQGAPVDLFVSAGTAQMDRLAAEKLIDPATRVNLLRNELVLVTPLNGPRIRNLSDLAGPAVKRIGLGLPQTVPAGKYAEETLRTSKLWDKLKPKLVMANDVRQVLTWAETGNIDAGFVYHSDAITTGKVKVALAVPNNLHKPITFSAAIIKNAPHKAAAREFLNYLESPQGMKVFAQCGFKPGGN